MSDPIKELQTLANINEDACEFYKEAVSKAKDPELKTTFRNLETLHKDVVVNLNDYIRTNGGKPDTDETFVGEMREFWGKMMASISNDVDATLIKHLEEAEDRCLHKMQDIMEDEDIAPETKNILQKEYRSLRKSHDYMKALKEMVA